MEDISASLMIPGRHQILPQGVSTHSPCPGGDGEISVGTKWGGWGKEGCSETGKYVMMEMGESGEQMGRLRWGD